MTLGISDCTFYHVMDIPGHGVTPGQWDLRETADHYLGNVDFTGMRVFEIGTASGFLCFHMEKRGADVTAFDRDPDIPEDRPAIAKSRFAARNDVIEDFMVVDGVERRDVSMPFRQPGSPVEIHLVVLPDAHDGGCQIYRPR